MPTDMTVNAAVMLKGLDILHYSFIVKRGSKRKNDDDDDDKSSNSNNSIQRTHPIHGLLSLSLSVSLTG
jgi:hypothetical protein